MLGIVQDEPRRNATEITDVVNTYCQNRLVTFGSTSGPSTSVTGEGAACTFPNPLTVRVTYQYDFLVLTNFGFGPINLEAQTVMRCE